MWLSTVVLIRSYAVTLQGVISFFILSGNTIMDLVTDHGGMVTGLREIATA